MTLLEQYAPPPAGDGWKDWAGGECPLPFDSLVEYKMRCGLTVTRGALASDVRWSHTGGGSDVIAYREK